ncbi:hypothetical protein [Pacificoceanicola onchidii]|uniref:hypothetical protein n=1 Tax=Pacificoceanicola onchidii TaxID=2562685 RepID=UPI0014562157|nr:hypothetical protein [Pacificoceanicola onchidii]
MPDENSTSVDLFGNVVFAKPRTKGRPPFERTEENAHKVSMLLAMGWSNSRIASVIRDPRTGKTISEPTLKRHFRSELQTRDFARDQLRARQLMMAFSAASSGNVGAMRFFENLVEKNDLMMAETRVGRPGLGEKQAPAKQERLGKKDQDKQAAQDAEQRLLEQIQGEANATRRH